MILRTHFNLFFYLIFKNHRSDTESAEDTTPKEDETDNNKEDSEDKKDENKKSAASGMVSRVSNIFAAMKKSVQKPKESKYSAETPESEMKISLFFVTEKFKKLIFLEKY